MEAKQAKVDRIKGVTSLGAKKKAKQFKLAKRPLKQGSPDRAKVINEACQVVYPMNKLEAILQKRDSSISPMSPKKRFLRRDSLAHSQFIKLTE